MNRKFIKNTEANGEWTQVTIRLDEQFQDNVVAEMILLGFGAFLQEPHILRATIERNNWRSDFPKMLREIVGRHTAGSKVTTGLIRVSQIQMRNWNKKCEKEVREVEATDSIVLVPSWIRSKSSFKGKTIIRIDPKMSFGTGHHETTRLCLRLAERYVTKGIEVLDFGCGTGVLAITAIKLGARHAACIDIDSWAIANTVENVRRNKVTRAYLKNGFLRV